MSQNYAALLSYPQIDTHTYNHTYTQVHTERIYASSVPASVHVSFIFLCIVIYVFYSYLAKHKAAPGYSYVPFKNIIYFV